jgi:osmotically-inducible protein OsmY
MKGWKVIAASLLACCAMGVTACSSDVDVEEDTDTTVIGGDTATTPGMSVDATTDTNAGADTGVGGDVAQGAAESMVESKLVMAPGFSSVEVDSGPDGAIILSGTVATQAEKDSAEAIAKGTDGVTSVTNNITVGQ